ncbi:hypothetical protein JCM33374_g3715 [Metschnikowia sp. JCM 33374]|nr:hypothetical protein JCM33374_g3715 [Metschnikowia sp. JCM 33374]
MFNKLKSFSEDVAKSFNEIQQGDAQKKTGDQIQHLKNSHALLAQKTPSVSDLTQPTDEENTPNGTPVPKSENISGSSTPAAKLPASRVENDEDTEKTLKPTATLANSSESGGSTDAKPPAETKPAPPDPLRDINLEELPSLVRSKLKKFVKYEEKYPVLLDAYKTEKRKGELIRTFEKVMSEVTPVSSISDVGLLLDYLKGLTDKATLSSEELRKSVAEASKLTRDKDALAKKLADAQKALKYAEETVGQKSSLADELNARNEQLETSVRALEAEKTSF